MLRLRHFTNAEFGKPGSTVQTLDSKDHHRWLWFGSRKGPGTSRPGPKPGIPKTYLSFARREAFWVLTFKTSTSKNRIFSSKFAFSLRFYKFSKKSYEIPRTTSGPSGRLSDLVHSGQDLTVRSTNWTRRTGWYFRLEQVFVSNLGSLYLKIENLAFDTVQFEFLKFLRRSFFSCANEKSNRLTKN